MIETCIIRPVTQDDLDSLFNMLVDLIHHEGLLDRFKMTRLRLEEELFGKNADWQALVASCNNTLAGFCLYSLANTNRAFNSTPMIQIDDLYVHPDYRQMRLGQKLIRTLAQIAKNKGIERINVFCMKDNLQGQNFYQKLGAEKLDFMDVYKILVPDLLSQLKE